MIIKQIDKLTARNMPGDTLHDAVITGFGAAAGIYHIRLATGMEARNVPGPASLSMSEAVMVSRNGGENVIVSQKPRFSGQIVEVDV